MNNTSDYLNYKEAYLKASELIEENNRLGLLIMFGINLGLRYCDLCRLHDEDLQKAFENDNILTITEKKNSTRKDTRRKIKLNNIVIESYNKFPKIGHLFLSNQFKIYDISYVNKALKKHFKDKPHLQISTHSMRKTFARTFYDSAENKEDALIKLSKIFNHKDISTTRLYLGITQQEEAEVYKSFENLI